MEWKGGVGGNLSEEEEEIIPKSVKVSKNTAASNINMCVQSNFSKRSDEVLQTKHTAAMRSFMLSNFMLFCLNLGDVEQHGPDNVMEQQWWILLHDVSEIMNGT